MDINKTNCPYCGNPLKEGRICSIESRAPYWLPGNSDLARMFVSTKAVKEVQGKVIGKASVLGFFQKENVTTSYCKTCNVLITFMNEDK